MTKILRTALLVALWVAPAQLALKEVDDPDLFLHLRTGEWVLAHGFPTTDPFSTFGEGKPYVAYSWLFDVVVHLAHRTFGWSGIVWLTLLGALAIVAALVRLLRGERVPFATGAVVLVLGLVAQFRLVSPRPWLFTIVAYALTVDVLARNRSDDRSRSLLLLPPLFALWANVHVQFIYGLFAVGAFWLEALWEKRRLDRALTLALAGSTLATLVNPYPLGVWRTIVEYAQAGEATALIQEHAAPAFRDLSSWCTLALAVSSVFVLGWRRERRPVPYLLLAVGIYFAFKSARDSWFVAIPAVAVLGGAFAADGSSGVSDGMRPTRGQLAISLAIAGAFFVLVALARNLREPALERALEERYPVRAAAFVEEKKLAGPIYNDYPWGDYLLWRLPAQKVSIDGRTNLHGDERIVRFQQAWSGSPAWKDDPDLLAAGVVIGDARAPLTDLLRRDARFGIAYEDSRAVVLVRLAARAPR